MFLNHSCEPNVGVQGQTVFVALRDVLVGEELTLDYGTIRPRHRADGLPVRGRHLPRYGHGRGLAEAGSTTQLWRLLRLAPAAADASGESVGEPRLGCLRIRKPSPSHSRPPRQEARFILSRRLQRACLLNLGFPARAALLFLQKSTRSNARCPAGNMHLRPHTLPRT